MSQFMPPSTKNSTFSLSNFPIRDSNGEKMPMGESGGLYQVTITKDFEFGFLDFQAKIF